jgi:hypothetical protein
MARIYSYVLKIDDGAAPNPFGGVCTLTICKPVIRRNASVGDWVIGTGSKNAKLSYGIKRDFSKYLVYAMKISEKKRLIEYDNYCKEYLPIKIPKFNSDDYVEQRGDCIYDFSVGEHPKLRLSVHTEINRETDLRGEYSLLSNHFYYFGEKPIMLPEDLQIFVKGNQGHFVFDNEEIINKFEKWIEKNIKNVTKNPQLKELLTQDTRYRCIYFDELND